MEVDMIPNPYKSKFVLFEGIDGSGKSEQYIRFEKFMKAYFPRVALRYCKEPDKDRPVGKQIYEILDGKHEEFSLEKMRPFHMQAFYIEDRMQNYRDNIIPGSESGCNIMQDRGVPSSLCYGATSPDEFYDFMGLHNRVFSAAKVPFFWPDLIIIYDIPAEVAVQRMIEGGKKLDKFESVAKLSVVRENYLEFAKLYPNCVVIDGLPEVQEVFKATKAHLLPLLGAVESLETK
jgi:dTMP kinase